jgi:hypothetical protein
LNVLMGDTVVTGLLRSKVLLEGGLLERSFQTHALQWRMEWNEGLGHPDQRGSPMAIADTSSEAGPT